MPQTHSIYTSPQNCVTHSRFNPERLVMYLGKQGEFADVIPPAPSVLFRKTKGQALTHTEMDANLCSFLLTCSMTDHLSGTVAHGEGPDWGTASWYLQQSDPTVIDTYEEASIRKRDEKYKAQFENAFITLSYASCSVYDQNGEPTQVWQYSHSIVKVQHTTPEILGMIANEYLSGSFEIQKNLKIDEGNLVVGNPSSSINRSGGDLVVRNHLFVSELTTSTGSLPANGVKKTSVLSKKVNPNSTTISESKEIQVWVEHTASVDVLEARTNAIVNNITASNDVYIQGNLHVDGTIWGNWIDPNYVYTGPSAHIDWDPNTSSSVAIVSDRRLKDEITPIAPSTSLQKVLKLNPVTFNWKPESHHSGSGRGLIAQDVLEVDFRLVDESEEYLKVKYLEIIPDLINCIKELRKEIDELKAQQGQPR